MTAEIRTPEGSGRGDEKITAVAASVLESAPVESAPVEPAPVEPAYERVDLDRYVVLNDGPVGYVESVPPLFVCYVGHPYAQASEIAQLHDFHAAVAAVVDGAVSSGHSKITA